MQFFKWGFKYVTESLMFISKGVGRESSIGKCVVVVLLIGFAVRGIHIRKIEPVGATMVRHLRRGNRDTVKALSICRKVNVIKIQSYKTNPQTRLSYIMPNYLEHGQVKIIFRGYLQQR